MADLDQPLQSQLEALLDDYRGALNACVGGLSEERAPVAGGLEDHTAEPGQTRDFRRLWFDQAVTCRTRAELGIPKWPTTVSTSTTTTPPPQCRKPIAKPARPLSRTMTSLALDDVVHGNRRGALSVRWVYLHVLESSRSTAGTLTSCGNKSSPQSLKQSDSPPTKRSGLVSLDVRPPKHTPGDRRSRRAGA